MKRNGLTGVLVGAVLSAMLVGAAAVTGQVTTVAGELKNLSRLWDGTDVALVSAGGALLVDGSATTQPVSGTFWQATQPVSGTFWQATQPVSGTFWQATQPVSIASMPSTPVTGTFWQATQPVSGTFWQATQPVSGTVTVTLPDEGQQTAANSISTTLDTDNDSVGAIGAAPPGETTQIAGVGSGATAGFLSNVIACDSWFPVDIVTATTTLVITGVGSRHVYICSVNLITALTNNVAIVAGTGATCATSTAGMNGGVTSAEGWNFSANGGIAQGNGLGAIMRTETTGDSVCIITSAATQLSGTIGYAIF